ncbi:MAG: GTPase HflX [Vampirovibrionales bacterium]|nr:GTPase HflX [Vampirovibrionales bacterium]
MLKHLERLYKRYIPHEGLVDVELAELLCDLTLQMRRPLTLLLDVKGDVKFVIVGEACELHQIEGLPAPAELMGQRAGHGQKSVDGGPRSVAVQEFAKSEADARAQSRLYALQTTIAKGAGHKALALGTDTSVIQYRLAGVLQLIAGIQDGFSKRKGEQTRFCDAAFWLAPVYEPVGAAQAALKDTWPKPGPEILQENDALDADVPDAGLPLQTRLSAPAVVRDYAEAWTRARVFEVAQDVYAGFWQWQQHALSGTNANKPRTILVGVHGTGHQARERFLNTFAELRELVQTLGANIVAQVAQGRARPDGKTYLGEGKAQALAMQVQQQLAVQVAVDDELSPTQHRELEKLLRVRVLDRTEVILDIFAERARSKEGQLQVELARLRYALPRLVRWRGIFEQQTSVAGSGSGGGGGKGMTATRGPGETRIEFERRVLRMRIHQLESQVEAHVKHRAFQRHRRQTTGVPTIALVGYTNAGKSTLMRALTGADVWVENQLFATLDPTVRQLRLPGGEAALLSDTVGFIQKLPTFLVQAFRATLEEVLDADILLHVWDISHPDALAQLQAVDETLDQLGVQDKLRLTACNKIDRLTLDNPSQQWEDWLADHAPASVRAHGPVLGISATQGLGVPALLEALQQCVLMRQLELAALAEARQTQDDDDDDDF